MIRIQTEPFDTGVEIDRISTGNPQIGAVVSFTGQVRDNTEQTLQAIELEHYPGMTERELSRIESEAHTRWDLQASLIVHRIGRLEVGAPIVLVVTAASHRGEAFAAAEFLMDFLKTDAPFWKKEILPASSHWVDAKTSDTARARRWTKHQ